MGGNSEIAALAWANIIEISYAFFILFVFYSPSYLSCRLLVSFTNTCMTLYLLVFGFPEFAILSFSCILLDH